MGTLAQFPTNLAPLVQNAERARPPGRGPLRPGAGARAPSGRASARWRGAHRSGGQVRALVRAGCGAARARCAEERGGGHEARRPARPVPPLESPRGAASQAPPRVGGRGGVGSAECRLRRAAPARGQLRGGDGVLRVPRRARVFVLRKTERVRARREGVETSETRAPQLQRGGGRRPTDETRDATLEHVPRRGLERARGRRGPSRWRRRRLRARSLAERRFRPTGPRASLASRRAASFPGTRRAFRARAERAVPDRGRDGRREDHPGAGHRVVLPRGRAGAGGVPGVHAPHLGARGRAVVARPTAREPGRRQRERGRVRGGRREAERGSAEKGARGGEERRRRRRGRRRRRRRRRLRRRAAPRAAARRQF